ncbi:hypothetical protein J3R83DRAFT_7515 [Lanmaoa asiatica]|nr:hypothetical protein J3R83DRAFT_7771 [Lanmaoa asiatica]KAH0826029.1 hypothetical protein J3R83DRAFT_7515 [Lanmaoa asiatica]
MTLSDWDNLEPAHGQGTERARVRDYSTTSSRTSPLSTILDLFSLDVESPAVKMVYQNMNGTRPPEARADNAIPGADKEVHLEYIRDDIRCFKPENQNVTATSSLVRTTKPITRSVSLDPLRRHFHPRGRIASVATKLKSSQSPRTRRSARTAS